MVCHSYMDMDDREAMRRYNVMTMVRGHKSADSRVRVRVKETSLRRPETQSRRSWARATAEEPGASSGDETGGRRAVVVASSGGNVKAWRNRTEPAAIEKGDDHDRRTPAPEDKIAQWQWRRATILSRGGATCGVVGVRWGGRKKPASHHQRRLCNWTTVATGNIQRRRGVSIGGEEEKNCLHKEGSRWIWILPFLGSDRSATGLNIDVLLKKAITYAIIESYEKIDGYEESENKRENSEIAIRETEKRRKIRDEMRSVLEEVLRIRNELNVLWDLHG
ncbi:hypothetical protein Syun_029394 [Stephania yunnanensis]|uniref:Uncharacterized protein n=1 Tax=Stephania yunnanensis TaxID=152371 RepID=A0AAP0HLB9_9MAGN